MTETILFSTKLNCSEAYVEHDELLMSVEAYIATSIILFFIGFFGFSLNLFVIILMWKDKQVMLILVLLILYLWTPINIILFNLICSDFAVAMFGNPWTLTSAIYRRWIFGRIMCKAYGFFMSLLGITSITTLTVLAFERYVMLSKPFKNATMSYKGSIKLLIGIWMYSFILTCPPLFGWGKYVNEAANISCSVNWEEQTWNALTYILYLFAFGLVVPLVVIVYSYVNIMNIMKQNTLRMGRVSKAEGRVAYMIFVMILAFLVAWAPYAVFALVSQFGPSNLISPAVAVIPAIMAKSSICYNPIVYIGLNTQFRQSWIQTCCSKRLSRSSSFDEYENTQGVTNSKYLSNTQDMDDIGKVSKLNAMSIYNAKYNKTFNRKLLENDGSQELSILVSHKSVTGVNVDKSNESKVVSQV